MFSKISFFKLLKTLVIGMILACAVFAPKLTFSEVQAATAEAEKINVVRKENGERRDISISSEPKSLQQGIQVGSEASRSIAKTTTREAEAWMSWAITPSSLSERSLSIYQRGLQMGNNPHAFSKVGDGEISAAWFLTDFDLGPEFYDLGVNADLQATIDYFSGSFGRQGIASRRGFNAQRVLDPALADPEFCQPNETPLDCEIRLHHPSFALISMGTNQVWQSEQFESGMRQIIEKLIAQGVLPVLSTKADNLEGDDRINMILARLAVEYDLPLWNFWLAVQPLPDHGLQKDLEHLTYFPNDFAAPDAMQFAWPVRNLSALQLLEQLMMDTQS